MSNGYAAYTAAQTQTVDARDVEYRLLAKVTTALMQSRDNPKDTKQRLEAAMWNRNVWSALRVDLSSEGNQLPESLRASLISVSLWIEKETSAIMSGADDLDALIDINRNIMAGLKPESHEDTHASGASSSTIESASPGF